MVFNKNEPKADIESIKSELLTLKMTENKEEIKKILLKKGRLQGHPVFVSVLPENIVEPLNVYPQEKTMMELLKLSGLIKDITLISEDVELKSIKTDELVTTRDNHFCAKLCKKLIKTVMFDKDGRLNVDGVKTKFLACDIDIAIESLGKIFSSVEAEKMVVNSISNKIKNVL